MQEIESFQNELKKKIVGGNQNAMMQANEAHLSFKKQLKKIGQTEK